jgi:hypothetical protein
VSEDQWYLYTCIQVYNILPDFIFKKMDYTVLSSTRALEVSTIKWTNLRNQFFWRRSLVPNIVILHFRHALQESPSFGFDLYHRTYLIISVQKPVQPTHYLSSASVLDETAQCFFFGRETKHHRLSRYFFDLIENKKQMEIQR